MKTNEIDDTERSSSVSFFSEIARESNNKLGALEPHLAVVKEKWRASKSKDEELQWQFEFMQLENNAAKLAVIVIIFSAITLEAYIYDYAARHFTDSFAKDYLDKLDPVSKWVIIPRLVTGKELPRQQKWFALLRNLVKERNSIIYSKSKDVPVNPEERVLFYTRQLQERAKNIEQAKQAISLLDIMSNAMQKIDPDEALWTKIYLSEKSEEL